MQYIQGEKIARRIREKVRVQVANCDTLPSLAAILIGDNAASKMYVTLKERAAQEVGINFIDYYLEENIREEDVLALIDSLNKDDAIDGILVQLPLPKKLHKETILQAIDPAKDVDGLHEENQKKILEKEHALICPFPRAILKLIEETGVDLVKQKAVVLANSDGFGENMAILLRTLGLEAEYILESDIVNKKEVIQQSKVVVTALGQPHRIMAEYITEGAIVIDGGIDKRDGKVCGDVNPEGLEGKAGHLTPVPGGVGPVTVASLIENVYLAARKRGKCAVAPLQTPLGDILLDMTKLW